MRVFITYTNFTILMYCECRLCLKWWIIFHHFTSWIKIHIMYAIYLISIKNNTIIMLTIIHWQTSKMTNIHCWFNICYIIFHRIIFQHHFNFCIFCFEYTKLCIANWINFCGTCCQFPRNYQIWIWDINSIVICKEKDVIAINITCICNFRIYHYRVKFLYVNACIINI